MEGVFCPLRWFELKVGQLPLGSKYATSCHIFKSVSMHPRKTLLVRRLFAKLSVMPSVTIELPEQLRARVAPFSRWLPVILEVSLLNLKSPAHQAAGDLIDLLVSNPSEQIVRDYQFDPSVQERVNTLLEKNRQGILSNAEAVELDDYLKLEHVVRLLKLKLKSNAPASV